MENWITEYDKKIYGNKNEDKIAWYDKEMATINKYRDRIITFPQRKKMVKTGQDIYTQKRGMRLKLTHKLVFMEM